jgi:nucleolar protein 58
MLVLFETPAGFALFKVNDDKKIQKTDNLFQEFSSVEGAQKLVSLKKFAKFKNTADALKATTKLVESKLSSSLKKFLKKEIVDKGLTETLAIADSKLGGAIKEKLGIQCIHDNSIFELMRGIRNQIENLVTDVSSSDFTAMSLGLSHSLSRYKLKFSPDKVDTMIVQAIGLLDDLDKELNTYAMRVREWYGWHFPELGRIITDNLGFAKVVKQMGPRVNAARTDFTSILPEALQNEIREAAQISMGTEVSEEDIDNIKELCDQVISITEYREQLFEYLKNRMQAIAPNLTVLVGELVGARLIAHAGSLLNLAKYPASTVQILGAEKALFRALKTKRETPKYGLIYHASLVGQTTPKNKGKISRMLAAKAAIATRCDALGEGEQTTNVGTEGRTRVEMRLKALESGHIRKISGTGKKQTTEKYDAHKTEQNFKKQTTEYNTAADSTMDTSYKKDKNGESNKRKISDDSNVQVEQTEETPEKRKKKKKQKDSE